MADNAADRLIAAADSDAAADEIVEGITGSGFLSNQDASFVTVIQGDGTVILDASSEGWISAVNLQTEGFADNSSVGSTAMMWLRLLVADGTAGEAGEPIIVDLNAWIAHIIHFGQTILSAPGTPLGHATLKIGGVTEDEIYHAVYRTGGGSNRIAFAGPDGVLLGTEDGQTLASGDTFEIQLSTFLYTN